MKNMKIYDGQRMTKSGSTSTNWMYASQRGLIGVLPAVDGGDPSPLFSTGEAAPAGLGSVLGSRYKKDIELMDQVILQQN